MADKIIKCSKCGLSLNASFAESNRIQCPRCETINVVPSSTIISSSPLVKDILGGLPLTADEAAIHKCIASHIVKNYEIMPPDIFRELKVTGIEYICTPVYVFECSATVRYTYQVGKDRQRRKKIGKFEFDETYTRFINAEDSYDFSGRVIVSGNSKYDDAFQTLYEYLDGSRIVSAKSLNYPSGVKLADTDIGISEAKNKVKAIIKNRTVKKIENRLDSGSAPYKDLFIKDSVGLKLDDKPKRIVLPLIRVTLSYKSGNGEIWLSGDAETSFASFFPADRSYQKKCSALKKVKPAGCISWGIVVLGIMAIAGSFLEQGEKQPGEGWVVLGLICAVALAAYFIIRPIITKSQLAKIEQDHKKIFLQFISKQVPLKGVFHEGLQGNPAAFPDPWILSKSKPRKR